ncbi:hypothetical protein BGX24_006170, partial [Mortierella sp. AD032]
DNIILPDPKIVEVVSSILICCDENERVLETPKRVDSKAFEITLETMHVYVSNVWLLQHHIQPLEQNF